MIKKISIHTRYVIWGSRHDQASVWYLGKYHEVLIYPEHMIWGTGHNWSFLEHLDRFYEV